MIQTPSQTVNGASVVLFQWQQAQSNKHKVGPGLDREGVAVWQKPQPGWLTYNVDAATMVDKGLSSFGCVLRDGSGLFVSCIGGIFAGISDPKLAEAMAFREALSWLKRKEVSKVYIELDALSVVQAFRNDLNDASYFGSLIQDCLSLSKDLRSLLVYYVRRSANVAAHCVAREASSLSGLKEWCSIPSFLIDVIYGDLK